MAKFCPRCGLIILDRTLPACPKCGAGLPWAVTNQPAAPPEPAEPALPADPALPAEPGQPAPLPGPSKTPKPFRPAPPAQEPGSSGPWQPARPEGPFPPAPPPEYIPPAGPSPSPARPGHKPVAPGGTGSSLAWIGICCGGIIFLIFISVFIAVLSDDSSSDSYADVTVSPAYDGDTPVTEAPVEITAAIGQTVSGDTALATAYSAVKMPAYTWTTSSSEYNFTEEAVNGTTWLVIDAEVTNTGSGTMYASTSDFYLADGEGNRYEPGLYYGDESFSYLRELSENQKIRGKIVFGIPPDARDLKLFYDFGISYHPDQVASWTIG